MSVVRGIKITTDNELSWVEVDDLTDFQAIVGGYIEAISLHDRAIMFCNEDGKVMRPPLPPNRIATAIAQRDVIVGDVIVVGPPVRAESTSLSETSETADRIRNVAAGLNATWV